MTKCRVRQKFRENIAPDLHCCPDIELPRPVIIAGCASLHEQMTHSDNRYSRKFPGLLKNSCVMFSYSRAQFLLYVLCSFRAQCPNVPVPQVRHSTHDEFRVSGVVVEGDDFVFARLADYVNVAAFEEFCGSVNECRGVVVARNDYDMTT